MGSYLDVYTSVFVMLAIFVFPTLLAQVIPLMMKKKAPPIMSFISSLMINCGYALVLYKNTYAAAYIPLFSVAALIIIFPWECIFGFNEKIWNHSARKGFAGSFSDKDKLIEDLKSTRRTAPKVHVNCLGYSSQDPGNFDETRDFACKSWQEAGRAIVIPNHEVVRLRMSFKYQMDTQYDQMFKEFVDQFAIEGYTHDETVSIKAIMEPGFIMQDGYYCTSDAAYKRFNFYDSCFAKFLWFVFTAIGYQSLFEAPFCSMFGDMDVEFIKIMSGAQGLRCNGSNDDTAAADNSFSPDFNGNGGISPLVKSAADTSAVQIVVQPPQEISQAPTYVEQAPVYVEQQMEMPQQPPIMVQPTQEAVPPAPIVPEPSIVVPPQEFPTQNADPAAAVTNPYQNDELS